VQTSNRTSGTSAAAAVEFTHSGYRQLLRKLKGAGYNLIGFGEADCALRNREQFTLMRHDIDFDLEKAGCLARIEQSEGVSATYFFMLRTEHYNVFSREGTAAIQEILNGGHRLGLHFDCASYPEDLSDAALGAACRQEARMLEDWFERKVEVVSYHRPAPRVLQSCAGISHPYPHTYLPLYTKAIHYCSDSRGEWKHGDPLQTVAFAECRPLHILIHPIWWCEDRMDSCSVLHRLLTHKGEGLKRSFAENCTIFR
jgi:hypothetical protein